MMSSDKNYDDLLYPLLHSEGNIIGFFDKIFDFLYRRTDFFKIKFNESSSLGFVPGEAEKVVRCLFCKYMEQAMMEQNAEREVNDPVPLDYIAEEVVSTSDLDCMPSSSVSEVVKSGNDDRKDSSAKEEKRNEEQSDKKILLMDPDCYNGSSHESYSWAQTVKDIDIRIKVPTTVTAGKQVRVSIRQDYLNAEALMGDEWDVLKGGELSYKINVEESTWTLIPREHIHVYLQKMQERWWDSAFVGDPKIDLKTIDPSIAYEDLDQDSQAKIEELMYNEHMKRLGKPNIQQNKIQPILKEAWNSEGSPFKGQPFDPSLVNIQNSENLT